MSNCQERIYLWPGEAPFTNECGEQPQPSLLPLPIEGSRGAVIVCPGGAYCNKAAHEGLPVAEMINEAGISAFVLDYRIKPCPHYVPLTDALRAIRVVRSLGYEKVGILGFSAGGHLACSAATLYTDGDPDAEDPIERLSSRPDAFLPCYAAVSLHTFTNIAHILEGVSEDIALRRRYSAELHITSDTPPCFMWHTAADKVVPVENSIMLALALRRKNIPCELHVFPEGRHGLSLRTEVPAVLQWAPLCQKWLLDQGFGA